MPSTMRRIRRLLSWLAAPLAVAAVTAAGKVGGLNPTTVGFLYLLSILGLATWGGWAVSVAASVASTLCFNYFFFPPFGTLTIHDPANWVALLAFLVAATLVSRLVTTARREAEEAERRRLDVERLLAEASRLEAMRESDALKTALLRAVSHDLRTPLTAMRLEIESLSRHLAASGAAHESLRHLEVEQARLARRIDNLLALARLEAGLARPHPDPTPPAALLRSACESLRLLLAGRPYAIRVEPGCPDLWVDPSLGLEIVINLLENAARSAPADQLLELAAAPAPPGRVLIEVLDRGPGIPEALRTKLDSASGGLGLRVAQSFAQVSGGSLALLDRPGGGTIARLELPAAEPGEGDKVEA